MKLMKRAIHLDFHTMPGIYNFNDRWDPEEFARILKNAKVKYINAFAKCNLGFAYYPTKIGIPYPGMKGDMFGDLLRECHKNDIGVSAYVNVGLDHEHARLHRDWCVLNKDGQVIYGDRTANFFRNMCYNHPGYRNYIMGIIKEILNNYDIDGLFLDCMGVWPCYGNECLEDMVKQGLDPLNDDHVRAHSEEVLMQFSRDVKKLVGNEKYLYLNGMPYYKVKDLDTHIEIECLPSAWSYDYFGAQAAYARNIQKKVLYMTGRFQKSWGDFGGLKSKASLENDIWDALSNALDVSIGDHMHPAENLEPEVYKIVGEIYSDIEKYEPWTEDAKYVADIGVLTDSTGFLGDTYKGLARMFGELKYSFDILNEDMDLSKYKVLVLPDSMKVTPKLKEKLEKHLLENKGILSTGEGGLNPEKTGFALEQWKFKFDGLDTSNSSYFKMVKEDYENIGNMRWAMYYHGILISPTEDTEVIAEYIKPYFNRHWDGFHGYYYTPPEKKTGHAAVARSGNIYHICFKVFEAYYNVAMLSHKAIVEYCMKKLLPKPMIKCEGIPSTARITLTEKEKAVQLHVKATFPEVRGKMDIIEEHQIIPAGAKVSVRGNYKKAYIAPNRVPIDIVCNNDYTDVVLPEVKGYMMIVLEK
ncbi:MAG TPA: hypothetical protein GXX37_10805 [Clostridiaceae bacterium]|nr:hypothetical protein [Clostridiaceae bacterium]